MGITVHLLAMNDGDSPQDAAARLLGEQLIAPGSIDKYDKNRIGFMVSMVRAIAPTLVEHDLIARASVMGITEAGALAKLQCVEFLDPPESPLGISVTVAHRFATIRVSESSPDRAAAVDLAREIAGALVRGAQLRAFDPASAQEVRIAAKGEGLIVPLEEAAASTTAQSLSLSADSRHDDVGAPNSEPGVLPAPEQAGAFIARGTSEYRRHFEATRVKKGAWGQVAGLATGGTLLIAVIMMGISVFDGQLPGLWRAGVWLLAIAAMVFFGAMVGAILENARTRAWRCQSRCPNCGYPRRGLGAGANCPECGAPSPDVG